MKGFFLSFLCIIVAGVLTSAECQQGVAGDVRAGSVTPTLQTVCRSGPNIKLSIANDTSWAIGVGTSSLYIEPGKYDKYRLPNGTSVFVLNERQEVPTIFYWYWKKYRINRTHISTLYL